MPANHMQPRSVIDRLLEKVTQTTTGCWVYRGRPLSKHGKPVYRKIHTTGGRYAFIHHVAYEHFVGPIPTGHTIDHLCFNTLCVNPTHLEPVRQRINVLRGHGLTAANAVKIACVNGHPYDETNTVYRVVNGVGHRSCRTCRRIVARRLYYKARNRSVPELTQ